MLKFIYSSERGETTPIVSVLLPVYNGERYLSECLDSVLGQTLEDIEVICIDDYSADNSLDMIYEYAKRDSRIRMYQTTANSGVDSVLNQGLDLVRGKYVHFIGDDDFLEREAYDVLVREADWFDLDCVLFRHKVVYETQEMYEMFRQGDKSDFEMCPGKIWEGPELYANLCSEGVYHPEAGYGLWRYDYLQRHHIRFGKGMEEPYGDHIFYFHIMLKAKRVKYIPRQLYNYRRHGTSTSVKVRDSSRESIWRGFRSIFIVACERMKLLGEMDSLSSDLVNFYVKSEYLQWIPKLEECYRVLNEPNPVPFKNPMHAYMYHIFQENMKYKMNESH